MVLILLTLQVIKHTQIAELTHRPAIPGPAQELIRLLPAFRIRQFVPFLTGIERLDAFRGNGSQKPVSRSFFQRLKGGIGKGIWLLGSEPSIGKTSLILQFARKAAADGAEVLFISFEQDTKYLQAKVIAAEITEKTGCKSSADGLMNGEREEEAEEMLRSDALFERIHFTKGENCEDENMLLDIIRRFCEKRKPEADQRGKPCIVFIDYLQIIPFSGSSMIRFHIDDFARRLRKLQMQNGICVFLISSLNRMSYMGPVRLDSFKESGVIEFTGDVVLGLNLRAVRSSEFIRLADSSEKAARLEAARGKRIRELEIACLKNKTGESNFSVDLNFDTETGIFYEVRRAERG